MLNKSINIMANELKNVLIEYEPTMILYGSVVLDDFKLSLSDIDFILLTEKSLDIKVAQAIVNLRQVLTDEHNGNSYFKLFEGVIIPKSAFINNTKENIVCWGISGQRIINKYEMTPFDKMVLLEYGKLIFGDDFRNLIKYPSRQEILNAIKVQYDIVCEYGNYGISWFFDIARCLYTLRTNNVISKTKALEWASKQNLILNNEVIQKALQIRRNPEYYLLDESTQDWMKTTKPYIKEFLSVLKNEIINYE